MTPEQFYGPAPRRPERRPFTDLHGTTRLRADPEPAIEPEVTVIDLDPSEE